MIFMSSTFRAAFIAAAACGVAACVVACGGGAPADPLAGMSASQITSKVRTDFTSVSSFQYSGTVIDSGQVTSVDMVIAKSGTCRGTITRPETGLVRIVEIGQTLWLQVPAKFWQSQGGLGSAEADLLAGRYIQESTDSPSVSALTGLCSAAGFEGAGGKSARVKKGAESTIDGQKVVAIEDSAGTAVAYVSDTATPELVRLIGSGGGTRTFLDFTGYGKKFLITAPPADEVIDGSKLGL
jgi:hypothetical protein